MKRILIAEDNDSNYILMTYILKGRYELERACNGQEAAQKAETESFDLVLMDLKMPLMDGLEATRRIKASHPQLPIIALTANVFETDRQQAAEAGCDDFLAKPVNREQCIQTIERMLNGANAC